MNTTNIGANQTIIQAWNNWKEVHVDSQAQMGRIMTQMHHEYLCLLEDGSQLHCKISGSFAGQAESKEDFPVVGDFVALAGPGSSEDFGIIREILPRYSAVKRGVAGERSDAQVLMANIDYLLLVFGLDGGRNFSRGMLERSLTAGWNSGAQPLVVLNKADAADEEHIESVLSEAEEIAFGAEIYVVSAHEGRGMSELVMAIPEGKTVAMLGKSGVGKSALVNALFAYGGQDGELAAEGKQRRSDNQGRHTTTNSKLYQLPWGGWIADVPGLRELKIWGDEDDLSLAFPDIAGFAEDCRFRDCKHSGEPGCAVEQAIVDGELDLRRLESYRKLQRELSYLERRQSQQAQGKDKARWKGITKSMRHFRKPGRG